MSVARADWDRRHRLLVSITRFALSTQDQTERLSQLIPVANTSKAPDVEVAEQVSDEVSDGVSDGVSEEAASIPALEVVEASESEDVAA